MFRWLVTGMESQSRSQSQSQSQWYRIFLVLCCSVLCSAEYTNLKLETCGGDGSVVVRHVDVNPMPVHIPGKVSIVVDASLTRPIHGPIGIKVKMYTKVWLVGWVKFPLCVSHIGTCDYMDICERLELYRERGCPRKEMESLGIKIPQCHCPLPPAEVQLAFRDLDLPKLPRALKMFAAGDYKVETRIFERGKEIGCYKAFGTLA